MRDRFGIFDVVIRIRKLSLFLVVTLRMPNSHYRRRLNHVILFRQSPAGRSMDALWRPYVDDDTTCQPQHLHLDATTPPRAPASLISLPSALSPLRFFLGELRRESAASPELSSPSLAKPARQKLR